MEIEGHPTQDIVEELERRGAARLDGAGAGPSPDALAFIRERFGDAPGYWLFLPVEAFDTGFDEVPG